MTQTVANSSHAAYLPAMSRPPHDPYRLPLNPRTGWRILVADSVEVAPSDGAVALSPVPATGPSLTDASGTFGGLTAPKNVAIGADHSVWLLDTTLLALKRFDPCTSRFETVPCIGGPGSGARNWNQPGGLGICGGNLFITDLGEQPAADNQMQVCEMLPDVANGCGARLQVFSLHGLLLRATWAPPPGAGLANDWHPVDVAFDSRGRVLVADKANGGVHVFNAGGCWMRFIDGLGAVDAITTDCDDRLYVAVGGGATVDVIDIMTSGRLERIDRTDAIADRFPACPIRVGAMGELYLGACCKPATDDVFDARGNRLDLPVAATGPSFPTEGSAILGPLDSRLFRCLWDRVSLAADVPKGSSIRVDSFTAATPLSESHIANLNEDRWSTFRTYDHAHDRRIEWDCLLRSPRARYLWLRLTFRGDGIATPRLSTLVVDYPRISARRFLPAVLGSEPRSADFTDRFLEVTHRTQRQIESTLDDQAQFLDPLSAPAERPDRDFLGWLAGWIGVSLDRHLPLPRRRALLKAAGKLFCRRGTFGGLREMILLYLGWPPDSKDCAPLPDCGPCTLEPPFAWRPPRLILEHFQLRRWMFLCRGRLGEQAALWGQRIVNRSQLGGQQLAGNAQLGVSQLKTTQDPSRDPFHKYAHKFSVFVPACVGRMETMRDGLLRLIEAESPAHAVAMLIYVEPRMRIGTQSMIGYDSVVACYPASNVRLADCETGKGARLGKATVLGASRRGGPHIRVGQNARISTTTELK